jgi:tetratricopeptide (TPR) repeat protein
VVLARAGDPYSLSFALALAGAFYDLLRDPARAHECAEEAMAIAREQGYPTVQMAAGSVRGWTVGGEQGVAEIESAIQWGLAVGFPTLGDQYGRLVQAHLEMGRTDEALAAANAGLDYENASESRVNLCRLHFARGEVLLQRGASEEAERDIRTVLELSRERPALWKPWELRAATSLARMLRDRGRPEEARALLGPVYGWFTEDFDTADLKDAKALLEDLA